MSLRVKKLYRETGTRDKIEEVGRSFGHLLRLSLRSELYEKTASSVCIQMCDRRYRNLNRVLRIALTKQLR